MEPVTVTKWRARNGEIYETREEAARVDKQLWIDHVKKIFAAGGLLYQPTDKHTISFINYLIDEYSELRNVVEFEANRLYSNCKYTTRYIWRADTEEQAALISTTLRKYTSLSAASIDVLIADQFFEKYLGEYMVLQEATTSENGIVSIKSGNYRIIRGLSPIIDQFKIMCGQLERVLCDRISDVEGEEKNGGN